MRRVRERGSAAGAAEPRVSERHDRRARRRARRAVRFHGRRGDRRRARRRARLRRGLGVRDLGRRRARLPSRVARRARALRIVDVCDATGERTLLKLEGIERRARLEHASSTSSSTSIARRRRRCWAASCGSGNSGWRGGEGTVARSGAARAGGGRPLAERATRQWVETVPAHTRRRADSRCSPVVFVALFFAVNWTYQVIRKPSELFFPISGSVLQGSGRDVARLWRAVRAPFDRRHDAGLAGRARAGRGLGQSRRAHVLAVQLDARAVRDLSARVERRRHVSDHGRHVRDRAALLRPSASRRRGGAVVRLQVVLVERRSTRGPCRRTPSR